MCDREKGDCVMSDVILSAIIGVIGVILGSIITILGGIWQSTLQFRRERLHKIDDIKKDLYSHTIDLLMKQDACIRKNLSKEECDAVLEEFNNLQSKMMLYASMHRLPTKTMSVTLASITSTAVRIL